MSAEFPMPSTKNEISEPSLINLSRLNSWSTKNTIRTLIFVAFGGFWEGSLGYSSLSWQNIRSNSRLQNGARLLFFSPTSTDDFSHKSGSNPTKATKIKVLVEFLVDQEFKWLRLIKDGCDIPFFVEGVENSFAFVFLWKRGSGQNRTHQLS